MGQIVRRLFNLYPGEEKKASLFAILGFLWALSVTCGLKYADALLLIHLGSESLPIAYTFAALGNILVASFMLYGSNVATPTRIFSIVICAGIGFYTAMYFFLAFNLDASWLWYALKIFGWIFFTVVVTCFWTFIDQYYHLQDAKRLYSLFSSSVFIGLASTGLIMHLGILDPKHLPLVIVVLLVAVLFLIDRINSSLTRVPDDIESESGPGNIAHSFKTTIRSIITSPFTMLLMAGYLLIQILSVLTEFNYLSDFDKHFDTQHSLTSGGEENSALVMFMGQLVAGVSICNLLFGLFIYSRLVRSFGISNLLACTPAVLFIMFSGWLFSDSLFFPILGFFVVEGMLYSVEDCNFTLSLNAVPAKLKYKIRITIESFFEPIGMLTSALIISFVSIDSRLIGLALAALALGVSFALRGQYFKGIYQNLSENAMNFQRSLKDLWTGLPKKDKQVVQYRLLSMLKHGDEQAKLLACEGLLAFEDSDLLYRLLPFTDDISTPGKEKFLKLISDSCFAQNNRLLDHLHRWILDAHDTQLRGVVNFYLAQHGLLHPEKAVSDLTNDDLILKAAAIVALKKSWAYQQPAAVACNRTLAGNHLQKLLDSPIEAELCMGIYILGLDASPHDVESLLPYLSNPSETIARAAALAISQVIDKSAVRYAQVLIDRLASSSDNEFRLSCLRALEKISDSSHVKDMISESVHFRPNERRLMESIIIKMGLRTVPTLISITKDVTMHDRCRVLSGRILGRLALPQLRANLYEIISAEIERAYFYFYHHHTIQSNYSQHDLRILQDALLAGYHSVIDFIIQMLGLAGSIEDCELLSRSLRSHNIKVRSQVVEALEKACDPRIFRMLHPLVADLPLEEKMREYRRGGRMPLSLTELLDRLDQSPSMADQIMSATLQYNLDLPNWRESLRQQMPTNQEIFHHFAYELLET